MKKKLIFIVGILFAFISYNVSALECVDYQNGNGTEEDPYQITNSMELYSVRCNLDKHFKLMNDIDLTYDTSNVGGLFYNDGKGWTSIGIIENTYGIQLFYGSFNGSNHKIVGLYQNQYIQSDDMVRGSGLFAALGEDSKVYNLTLTNVNISVNYSILNFNNSSYLDNANGSLASYINGGIVDNIHADGSIKITEANSNHNNVITGGIAGSVSAGKITNAVSNVNIKDTTTSGGIGGIVGLTNGSEIKIVSSHGIILDNCINNGSLVSTKGTAGGIAASSNSNQYELLVSNCKNYGVINAIKGAGLFYTFSNGKISKSINYGDISIGSSDTSYPYNIYNGGLVGELHSYYYYAENLDFYATLEESINAGNIKISNRSKNYIVGGLVGYLDENCKIIKSYNIGNITLDGIYSDMNIGGLVGKQVGEIIQAYNVGKIDASYFSYYSTLNVGELVGYSYNSNISNIKYAYFLKDEELRANCKNTSNGFIDIEGFDVSQMKDQASYIGYDHQNTWNFDYGTTYPFPILKRTPLEGEYLINIQILNQPETLVVNDDLQMTVYTTPIEMAPSAIEYRLFSDNDIASISSEGLLNVYGSGKVKVYACSKKLRLLCDSIDLNIKEIKDVEYLSYDYISPIKYDGSAHEPNLVIHDNDYILMEGIDYKLSYRNNINAGLAVILVEGIGYYKNSKEIIFQIEKADYNFEAIDIVEINYDGNYHGIDLKIPSPDMVVKYKDENDEYTILEQPKYKDVGTYYIEYELSGDNYNISLYGSTLKINKADFNYECDANDVNTVYDEKEHWLNITCASPELVKIKYADNSGKYILDEVPKYKDVGNYTVNYQLSVNSNYNNMNGTSYIKISRANITDNTKDQLIVYDGKEHQLNLSIPATGLTIKYKDDDGNYTLSSMPKYKNVGNYKINYKVISNNYNEYIGEKTLSIQGIQNLDSTLKLKDSFLLIKDGVNNLKTLQNRIKVNATSYKWKHLDSSKKEISDELFKTGNYIQLDIDGSIAYEYQLVILGDLTGDGRVNSADLLQMRKYLLEEVNLTGAHKEAGIIESVGNIKSLDLLRLRQYLLGEYVFK